MKLAFASDFDQTLYDKQYGFRKKDLLTIAAFQKEGNLFGVCTGRSYHGVLVPTEGQIIYDFYILATGSLILDKEGRTLYSNPVPNEVAEAIIKEYQDKYLLAINSGIEFYSFRKEWEIMVPVSSLNEIKEPIHGLSFLTNSEEEAIGLAKEINDHFPVSAFNNQTFVDVTGLGSSKGKAIQFIKNYYHLDQVAAMGDNYNDISMLKEAYPSFTFPDSPNEVKKIVSGIKDSISDAILYL